MQNDLLSGRLFKLLQSYMFSFSKLASSPKPSESEISKISSWNEFTMARRGDAYCLGEIAGSCMTAG